MSDRAAQDADCGYQHVECWVRQLRAAGWLPVNATTGVEVPGSTIWRDPNGLLYFGPFKAWTVMRNEEYTEKGVNHDA